MLVPHDCTNPTSGGPGYRAKKHYKLDRNPTEKWKMKLVGSVATTQDVYNVNGVDMTALSTPATAFFYRHSSDYGYLEWSPLSSNSNHLTAANSLFDVTMRATAA